MLRCPPNWRRFRSGRQRWWQWTTITRAGMCYPTWSVIDEAKWATATVSGEGASKGVRRPDSGAVDGAGRGESGRSKSGLLHQTSACLPCPIRPRRGLSSALGRRSWGSSLRSSSPSTLWRRRAPPCPLRLQPAHRRDLPHVDEHVERGGQGIDGEVFDRVSGRGVDAADDPRFRQAVPSAGTRRAPEDREVLP